MLAEGDRPAAGLILGHADQLLAPLDGAARKVAGRWFVIDDDDEQRPERQLLERQLGADEGEWTDLTTQIQRWRWFTR
jgi:hypothetical protein